jgi:hypothetical protein
MPIKRNLVWVFFFPAFFFACANVGDFSTDPGECYEGKIIAAEYIRSDTFPENLSLTMTLDADGLGQGKEGAVIATHDSPRTFDNAPVTQMTELSHDSLSMLQFPGGRVRNYLAYAQPSQGQVATIVISLMENDEVEVRIMRPDLVPDGGEDTSLFGVFRLVRKEGCAGLTSED